MEEGWCTATVEEGKNVRSDSQEKGGAQRRSRRAETVEGGTATVKKDMRAATV